MANTAFLAAALAASAPAAAPAFDLTGVWHGTIGTLPVRACFARRDWGAFGAYFYMSRLRTIPLEAEEGQGSSFREGGGEDPKRPRWRIEKTGPGLSGSWSGGGRTLPIRLAAVRIAEGEEDPCASRAFHEPRLQGVRTVSTRGAIDGVAYTRLTLSNADRFDTSVETLALDGASAAVRRINAELARPLSGEPPPWLECIQEGLRYTPYEGWSNETLKPAMATARWLSVAHHWDGFCGGAHPDSSDNYRTFDRFTGAELDVLDWLNASAVKRERSEGMEEETKTLRPAFRRVVIAGWKAEDKECATVAANEQFWNAGLSRTGFIFTPQLPHVAHACAEALRVPFARLRPFLTPEGVKQVRALESENRR